MTDDVTGCERAAAVAERLHHQAVSVGELVRRDVVPTDDADGLASRQSAGRVRLATVLAANQIFTDVPFEKLAELSQPLEQMRRSRVVAALKQQRHHLDAFGCAQIRAVDDAGNCVALRVGEQRAARQVDDGCVWRRRSGTRVYVGYRRNFYTS